ncbi:MAG: TIGR04376 family protein [Jaaginema sp. PMC 1080.18]|nr:TIGR04376 family protein [Jaaginema sp. PMC 1080.18]MEC4866312.1 TIGR04376 family protein [Jaaginema sp. PMC 1078.18]
MGLFDDFSQFLEMRLEEFLRSHPHLELQALEEQLRQQEDDTLRLILSLQREEKQLEQEILAIAQDIKRWHERIEKANASGRQDLAQAAQEREAALLRQGNQRWGQRQGLKNRINQAKDLVRQIQRRRDEVEAEFARVQASQTQAQTPSSPSWDTGWHNASSYSAYNRATDPLEKQFQDWEADAELEQMKRNLGR